MIVVFSFLPFFTSAMIGLVYSIFAKNIETKSRVLFTGSEFFFHGLAISTESPLPFGANEKKNFRTYLVAQITAKKMAGNVCIYSGLDSHQKKVLISNRERAKPHVLSKMDNYN